MPDLSGCYVCSTQHHAFRGPVKNPVEEQLVCSMRLRSEQNLRTKKEEFSLSDANFDNRRTVLKMPLAPGPATMKRGRGVVPCNGSEIFPRTEGRAVVEEKVCVLGHSVGERVCIIHASL